MIRWRKFEWRKVQWDVVGAVTCVQILFVFSQYFPFWIMLHYPHAALSHTLMNWLDSLGMLAFRLLWCAVTFPFIYFLAILSAKWLKARRVRSKAQEGSGAGP